MKKLILMTTLAICFFAAAMLVSAQADTKPQTLLSSGKYIPDISTFMQIGAASPAGYSWDGKSAFFRSSMSGASQIYRLTEEGWPYQLTTFADGVDFFSLSPSGAIGIVGASVGGNEDAQLYLIDTHTGQIHQLTNASSIRYGAPVWSPDDKYIMYRSNEENGQDFFIYRMDLATGVSHKIFGDTTGVRGYLAVDDVNEVGTKLIVTLYTSNINNDLYLLDLETLEYEKLTDDGGDVYYGAPTLMSDNNTVWLTSNNNADGISRLAKLSVATKKLEFIDDGWIDPRWEVEGLGFSRDFKYMRAAINEEGYVRMKIREVESGKQLPSPPLDGMLGGGLFDKNGTMLISFAGPTRAPDVWKWNPVTEELTQKTFSMYSGIDRKLFTPPKLVSFKSFDDLEIPAFLYLPPDYVEGEPIPFIVHAHGGPESQFQPAFIRNFQYLMLNGYGLLAVNPRGSSGYGQKYINLDNYKLRKNSLKDYKASVDWLLEKGYTQKGMIGVRGGSYGGYVVLGMITEYPDLFSAAVDIVGIANFKTFLENTRSYRRALREAEYGPLSDPDFLTAISPVHKAHLIKTPLLVIHGENDPRVPVDEARQVIKAVMDNGGVVDSLIFPDEGHGVSKRVNIITEYRMMVEFFDKHLKGDK